MKEAVAEIERFVEPERAPQQMERGKGRIAMEAIGGLAGPNDEIAKSEGRGQHREKLARHFPCCHTCFSRIS
jgi:hypothetical protein